MGNKPTKPPLVFELAEDLKTPGSSRQTDVYQVQDGRFFYSDGADLYVKHQGQKVFSKMRELFGNYATSGRMGVCGNAVYFAAKDKIHKAEFVGSGIDISYVRDMLEGEEAWTGALCARRKNGSTFGYKMDQDPEKDAVDSGGRILLGLAGKHLFVWESHLFGSWLMKSSDRTWIRSAQGGYGHPRQFYAPNEDDPSLVYVTNGHNLAEIRDGVAEELPFTGVSYIDAIVGVHKGVMTVQGRENTLWKAKLMPSNTCPNEPGGNS